MKLTYDPQEDMLYIELTTAYPHRTDTQSVPGIAVMYDADGRVCGMEIEDASTWIEAPNRVNVEYLTETDEAEEVPATGD